MKALLTLIILLPFIALATITEELRVYDYYIIQENNEVRTGFVVLSDGFPYEDYKENNIIAPENLGEFEYTNDNYHTVNGIYRQRFLKALGITETDSLFVNNLSTNTIKEFKVKSLKLTAFLTPYGPNTPIENWDYLVGFELDSLKLPFKTPETYNQTIFSCVGPTNPFNLGKAKPMQWEKIDNSEFIWELTPEETPKYMLPEERKDAFLFKLGKMNFYVQEIQAGEYMFGYHLVVADSKTNEKLFSTFFFESESSYTQPLNGQKNSWTTLQFTGYIFKDKPPIIYGFQSNTFGCPYISFADKDEPLVWLRCDNRH